MARKMSRRLVVMSSAAIMAVYAAGYVHTEPAAAQLAANAHALPPATATPQQAAAQQATPTPSNAAAPTAPAFVVPSPTALPQRDSSPFVPPYVAPAAPTATAVPVAPAAQSGQYRDGSYTGMGENRHGDLTVTVVIKGGRITSADISDCGMQYPCSRIEMLPGQAVARQSADVDLVSRATMSSEAYQEAVQQALSKAAI